ncbi:hypothetical protein [Scytonema sp. HK-05]|nr:hypothetical protein [Scytonema sp. HK-05]
MSPYSGQSNNLSTNITVLGAESPRLPAVRMNAWQMRVAVIP